MADRYWVGGTGTWDTTSTANWSASSGGAPGASVPTSVDNVFFDANSNATSYTVTIASTNVNCANWTVNAPATGVVTLSGSVSSIVNIYGNLYWVPTGILINSTLTGFAEFRGTSNHTISTNNVTNSSLRFNVNTSSGTYRLTSAMQSAGLFVTQGNFNSDVHNISASFFTSSGNNNRSIDLGSSTIILYTNGSVLNLSGANLAFNANNSTIQYTGSTFGINSDNINLNVLKFDSTGSGTALNFNTSNVTVANLTISPILSVQTGAKDVTFSGNTTTISNLVVPASDNYRRVLFRSSVRGAIRTITVNNVGIPLVNCDFQDIAVAGNAAPLTGTRLGNGGNNNNIIFDPPKTVYWSSSATDTNWIRGNIWATGSPSGPRSLNNLPLPQDTAVITDAGPAANAAISIDVTSTIVGNIDSSARTIPYSVLFVTNADTFCGNLLFSSATTWPNNVTGQTFYTTMPEQIVDVKNQFLPFSITLDSTGNLKLGSSLRSSTATNTLSFTHTRGNIVLNGYDLIVPRFNSSGSSIRGIDWGTGSRIYLTDFSTSTPLNLNAITNLTYMGKVGTYVLTGNTGVTPGNRTVGLSFETFTGHNIAISGNGNVTLSGTANDLDFSNFSGYWLSSGSTARNITGNLILGSNVAGVTGSGNN